MASVKSVLNRGYHHALDAVLRVDGSSSLNEGRGEGRAGGADIAQELRAAMQAMTAEAFDAERGGVDYGRLKTSGAYAEYRECTTHLLGFDLGMLETREEKLAFWMNLYNALVIDAVIEFGVGKSVRDDTGFFRRAAYKIRGLRFSADDVEHGILRGNRRHFHPAIPFAQFAPDDPRLAYSMTEVDPRVHCALVCASRGCPPIGVYDGERIDGQLDVASSSFVNGGAVRLGDVGGRVLLSEIFRWYAGDFGGSDGVVEFVLRYLDDGPAREALADWARIGYQEYDWTLNGA
jgi:hypothetical protein